MHACLIRGAQNAHLLTRCCRRNMPSYLGIRLSAIVNTETPNGRHEVLVQDQKRQNLLNALPTGKAKRCDGGAIRRKRSKPTRCDAQVESSRTARRCIIALDADNEAKVKLTDRQTANSRTPQSSKNQNQSIDPSNRICGQIALGSGRVTNYSSGHASPTSSHPVHHELQRREM
ncbi:hypothetical protein BKA81DRAFT_47537 [Phyllosticta paracitricarpa]